MLKPRAQLSSTLQSYVELSTCDATCVCYCGFGWGAMTCLLKMVAGLKFYDLSVFVCIVPQDVFVTSVLCHWSA